MLSLTRRDRQRLLCLALLLQAAETVAVIGLIAWQNTAPSALLLKCPVRTLFRIVYREAHVALVTVDVRYVVLACLLAANLCQWAAQRWAAWQRELAWVEQGLTYLLMLWVMALRVGLVDVYGLVCLGGLVCAAHALRLCADFLLLLALGRVDTDGTAGALEDRCLQLWDTRLWVPAHLCAWWWTGTVVAILGVHHALYQPSTIMPVEVASMHAFVWGELALLAGICALHTRVLLTSSRIVESPARFEQVFCSAKQLRTGELGIKGDVADEEGGVILSLTRAERLQAAHPLSLLLDTLAHGAVRTVMVWTLFGPLLLAV